MKAYTDLEQSKKLEKILPLESADLYYDIGFDKDYHIKMPTNGYFGNKRFFIQFPEAVPCWSLAALLEEIPEIINFDDDESDYALEILKEGGLYYLSYGNLFEHDKIEIEPQEYFVDACYEMIIKLYEQNIL